MRTVRTRTTAAVAVLLGAVLLLASQLVVRAVADVSLRPDDAALVRETLSPAEHEPAWTIVEDPLSDRGGCSITTDNSRIDASNESRLQAAIRSLNGDERQ